MYEGYQVVELARVSTAEQAAEDRAGISRQLEDNRRTIERHKLKSVREPIVIRDVSGTNVNRCPEIQELLLPLMVKGRIQGVVVSDMDRLIRPDNFDDYSLLQRFKENKILIFTADNVIDFNTRSGFLVGGMKATIAGDDLSNIKKKMQDGKEQRRLAGKSPGNALTLPFGIGYDRGSQAYTVTEKIETVRDIFRLFVEEGWTMRAIAERTGLTGVGVGIILQNPIYAGWRLWLNKTGEKYVREDGRQASRRKIPRRPDEIIVKRVFEVPPVEERLFIHAQSIMNQIKTHQRARRMVYPHRFYYTGHLLCAVDGEIMFSRGGETRGKADYHVCRFNATGKTGNRKAKASCESPYANRAKLYASLDAFISEVLGDRRVLGRMLEEWSSRDGRHEELSEREGRLRREVEGMAQKRARLLLLYAEGTYAKEELDRLATPNGEALAAKQEELSQLVRERSFLERVGHADIVARVVQVFREFHMLTDEQKRRLLRKSGIMFKVWGNEIRGVVLPWQILESVWIRISEVDIRSGDRVSHLKVEKFQPVSVEVKIDPPYIKTISKRPLPPIAGARDISAPAARARRRP